MKNVALVTFSDEPDLTPDDALLIEPLERLGIDVHAVPWDLPCQWEQFDLIVLRSTWGYHKKLKEFTDWIKSLHDKGFPVQNPEALMLWNTDKHYLLELKTKGFNVMPGIIVEQDAPISLAKALQNNNWNDAVFKPVISASAFLTHRTSIAKAESDQAAFEDALAHSAVLVQPFAEEVCAEGEWSLIFFDGVYSHAVLKIPAAGEFRTQPSLGGQLAQVTPSEFLVTEAQQIVDSLPQQPLYARVDGINSQGHLLIMELELIEPALWISSSPGAPERMATAISSAIAKCQTAIL
ncbi:MAG: hypothetical protein SGJ27_27110 [Candidatus Melainabacteria bacterium]|nr:hypothetical protein [Candidatus Melainabacteria bacterium]